jgi:hypothetical protein
MLLLVSICLLLQLEAQLKKSKTSFLAAKPYGVNALAFTSFAFMQASVLVSASLCLETSRFAASLQTEAEFVKRAILYSKNS